jgi:F-type H+-transporting ATPase subunit a
MNRAEKILYLLIFLILCFQLSTTPAIANKPESELKTEESSHEKFNPGDFIFDHVNDSYGWHIMDIGQTSIGVPLPVILISKEKGLVMFWSSKLANGNAEYKGFRLETEGENKGKIVETLSNGQQVLPFDISITKNIAALFFSVILILWLFITVGNAYKRNPLSPPKGLQSFVEPVILFVRDDIAIPAIGEKKYARFMPYLLTIFFFIWINNMLGLVPILPGGANVTGNIAVTMVLAACTFVITTINGNKIYWKHIVNTPGVPLWLKLPPAPIMPFVELLGVFTKPIILAVRLFANITAGHIIGMGFLCLIFLFGQMSVRLGFGISIVSLSFLIFMTILELLVAFIQAYVFTFLSALYFGMATVEEHH